MFRTPIKVSSVDRSINLRQPGIAMGSCFADFMGEKMAAYKFNIIANPMGILYHPMAMVRIINMAYQGDIPEDESYLHRQGIYYNYNFHSRISHEQETELKKTIKFGLQQINETLRQSDYLILTFGTAFQYQHKDPKMPVANCHKMPGSLFERNATSADAIIDVITQCQPLMKIPQVLVSVSPIRHIKDGLIDNSYSKSILRVVCQELVTNFPNFNYFPGYEIMMDDLRDYRFYHSDMIHPNEVAQDYLWKVFVDYYLDSETAEFVHQWSKILQNLNHKPFNPQTTDHRNFVQKTLRMLDQLPDYISCQEEKDQLMKQLYDR